MATFIVSVVVLCVVGAIIWKMISDRKNGKRSCSGSCDHCSGACAYHNK